MPYITDKNDYKTGFYSTPQFVDSLKEELIIEVLFHIKIDRMWFKSFIGH